MRFRYSLEQTLYGFSAYYIGMVSEDWRLGAPPADLHMNIGFLIVTVGVAGILNLIRRRQQRARPT